MLYTIITENENVEVFFFYEKMSNFKDKFKN